MELLRRGVPPFAPPSNVAHGGIGSMKVCIIVASHIEYAPRIKLLMECLESLLQQTARVPIFLSISFKLDLLRDIFDAAWAKRKPQDESGLLQIHVQESKCSQFRHIYCMINKVKNDFDYVMFCDDDDTYHLNRVEVFQFLLAAGETQALLTMSSFAGVYEIDNGKSHSIEWKEYWSYAVHMSVMIEFHNRLQNNDFIIYMDHCMCDILFSTFLRCLKHKIFIRDHMRLYNYNFSEDRFSFTTKIKDESKRILNQKKRYTNDYSEFIISLNNFLWENMGSLSGDGSRREPIMHNMFYFVIVNRPTFDAVLQRLLGKDYVYIKDVDPRIIHKFQESYDSLCKLLSVMCDF